MKHLNLNPKLHQYIMDVSVKEHPILKELREDTSTHPLAIMQIAPEQGQFFQFLIHLIQAEKVLELGTFTGYSTLAIAMALPEHGKIITCDLSEEWTKNAHPFWNKAEQQNKIELKLGPALQSLEQLVNEGHSNSFDFIFIDADKTNYVAYYEYALQLLKPHGLIAIDNVLWEGKVVDEQESGGQTREIRRLNSIIKNDSRVFSCLLPIADGIFMVQRK
jgi:predicted O-methyltransferase YrrM